MSDARDQLKAENEKLRRSVASLTVENAFLRQKLDALAKRYFGKKTEKLSPDQLQLLLSGLEQAQEEAQEEAEEPPARTSRKRQRKTRMQVPDNLPVEEELLIPEEVKAEPQLWKKNWLFMGSKDSGHCSAVVYTLVQSCRMIDVEPSAYLRDVLEHLPTLTNQEIDEWTPMKWAVRNGLLKATSRAA